jgi:hypothetical protein
VKEQKMDFETALNKLPDGTGFDSFAHKTVKDLCYLCLHELDLHAEQEYWHPVALRKKYLAFCKKFGFYAKEAEQQFDVGRHHRKEDACM